MRIYNYILLSLSFFILSCDSKPEVIEVVYEVNEMKDSGLDVTFTIKNLTKINFNSIWSLHWNQQST